MHTAKARFDTVACTAVQRIDALLEAVEVEEVAFQQGCQASELRAVLASSLAKPQHRLSNMHGRIQKHLGATAPKLAAEVRLHCSPKLVAHDLSPCEAKPHSAKCPVTGAEPAFARLCMPFAKGNVYRRSALKCSGRTVLLQGI